MNRPVPRRVAALTAAAMTAGVLGVLSAAVPAAADGGPVITLRTPATVAVPTAAASGVATSVEPQLTFTTDSRSVSTEVTITIDARKLAAIADVSFSDNCTVQSSVATCDEYFYDDNPTGGQLGAITRLTVSARAGVAPGATAPYTISGTATSGSFVGATGTVTVGGPAFDQSPTTDHTGLPVGSTVSEPVEFTNTGDRPAAAAEALLTASPGLTFADHYSNCVYSSVPDYREAEMALCAFPQPIHVGERVALSAPVTLHVTSTAYYTYLDTLTVPKGGDPYMRSVLASRTWTKGTGGTLGLTVEDPGRTITTPVGTVQLQLADNHSDGRVAALQAANTADFSVTGATAQGAQGDSVTLAFSMTDKGPATIFYRSGESIGVTVTPPPGTTVTGSSANCRPENDEPSTVAHGPYYCADDYLVPAGRTSDFGLTLRVDQVVPGARGSVAMDWSPDGSWRPPFDTDPSDDTAALVLN